MARSRHLTTIHLVCLSIVLNAHHRFRKRNLVNVITQEERLHRRQVREEMLHDLSTSGKCRELICMNENAFKLLCQKLRDNGGLRATQ